MQISWGKSYLNGDMLFIRNSTVGVYKPEVAIELFPEDAPEILKFIKYTRLEVYKEMIEKNPNLEIISEKRETAQIAAKWWADKLRNGTVQDNGEEMQSMMMTLLTMRAPKKDEKDIEKFEQVLTELIDDEIESRGWAYLRVDYFPDGILKDAAEIAKIEISFELPVKTWMRVSGEEVSVAEGYGSSTKQLYPIGDRNKKK